MRSKILTALVATLLPLSAMAQDDMYFVPSKEQVKAEKEARQKQREADKIARQKQDEELRQAYIKQNNRLWKMDQIQIGKLLDMQNAEESKTKTYYSGINKSVDDYNRRATQSSTQADTTVYSKDSIASDIIDFAQGNGYPTTNERDTIYIIIDDDDYRYSRWMSRWDDDFWWHGGWRPWGWGFPGYYAGWYGPWYDPFFDPWFYDPWYYGYGWYGPYWSYNPWYYRHGWNGWNGWDHYGHGGSGGYVSSGGGYSANHHGYGPTTAQRSDSHFYGNHTTRTYNSRTPMSSSSSSYSIAQRNGGGTNRSYGTRVYNDGGTGWSHSTFRSDGSGGSSNYSSPRYNTRSYSGSNSSSSRSYSSSSSYSGGGGHSSGGGSSSSYSGGGGSSSNHGGGHGGGGRHR